MRALFSCIILRRLNVEMYIDGDTETLGTAIARIDLRTGKDLILLVLPGTDNQPTEKNATNNTY